MTYLWQEFNIKTFPAETIVFKDSVFMPELSTLDSLNIDKKYDLPVHIIYIGEIDGAQNLEININVPDQKVFLTAKIKNNLPAFLNIFVKNTGKNSEFIGNILAQNYSDLKIDTTGLHATGDTTILITTKVVAHFGSNTKLIGTADINAGCTNCTSDVGFSVLADPSATIEFNPRQMIASAPKSAEHSASLYRGSKPQIEYLRTAGLSAAEIKDVLEEAFLNS